jgi:hypothetical protein
MQSELIGHAAMPFQIIHVTDQLAWTVVIAVTFPKASTGLKNLLLRILP